MHNCDVNRGFSGIGPFGKLLIRFAREWKEIKLRERGRRWRKAWKNSFFINHHVTLARRENGYVKPVVQGYGTVAADRVESIPASH